jgi:hypothetical protein
MLINKEEKETEIIQTISNRIGDINDLYRRGPSLYFYKRLNTLRNAFANIEEFFNDDYNIEIIYATLVAWGMDSRGAKMKCFEEFRENLISCIGHFTQIEEHHINNNPYVNTEAIIPLLTTAYENLILMDTNGRLVSNSKLLHFLFPKLCMPMDRTNTLMYLYGTTYESIFRYKEIIQFSFEVINSIDNWTQYLDNNWNTSAPKLIDNAIILMVGESTG